MRKLVSFVLALAMCLALAARTRARTAPSPAPEPAKPEPSPAPEPEPEPAAPPLDAELRRAVEVGLVPDELLTDLDAQISYAEFCAVLDRLIGLVMPECLTDWKQTSAKYHDAPDKMSRIEGALVLFYAAECLDLDAAGYYCNIPLEDLFIRKFGEGLDFYSFPPMDFPLLPDVWRPYYNETLANSEHGAWRNEYPYANNVVWFVECFSYGNGKTYLDYDENYTLDLAGEFTRDNAIHAAERFYETALFFVYEPVESLHTTLSEETLSKAAAMPAASYDHLPEWTGYTVMHPNEAQGYVAGLRFRRDEIEAIASQGFNFVRVPLNFDSIFSGTDTSRANPTFLENMDDLLTWAAEYGIHVCFDLHDMPGFTTDVNDSNDTMFRNETEQALLVDFWRVLAAYFKDVPSNLLSFDLLNEPHGYDGPDGRFELTDEVYSAVMRRVIDAIRESTPDRLIFADVIDVINSTPVYGLAESGVVQSWHPYFLGEGTAEYPSYAISGFVKSTGRKLSLKGNFPAGTTVQIGVGGFHLRGSLSLTGDKRAVSSISLGNEAIGENGCVKIAEAGTGGECRFYQELVWESVLPDGASALTIRCDTGWYQLDSIRIDTGETTYSILCDHGKVIGERTPVLTLAEDGSIAADIPEALIFYDRSSLAESFAEMMRFREDTGEQFMAQEFGFSSTIKTSVTLAAAEDILSVFDEFDIPWCCWNGSFGPLVDKREAEWHALTGSRSEPFRDGATVEQISENWLLDTAYMEVLKKHM